MPSIAPYFAFGLETALAASIVALHFAKKDRAAVWTYAVQSVAVAGLLLASLLADFSPLLLCLLAATVLVKVFLAPAAFFRVIRKHRIKLSASANLHPLVTLVAIAAIAAIVNAAFSKLAVFLAPLGKGLFIMSAAAIFISLFLLVNRKGALSQVLGVLSLENSIISFALLAGLEQNPAMELGIIFDIAVWVIIASVLASMMHAHFGSLDASEMKQLTD